MNTYRLIFILIIIGSLWVLLSGQTPWHQVQQGMIDHLFYHSNEWNPLLDERLPRLIVILCTGASLAVSGAVMQAVFQNPLASPSILGITAGGSLSVIFVLILNLQMLFPFAIPLAAVLGCLITLFIVYGLYKSGGFSEINSLILTGIAISTLLLAVQGAILYAKRSDWQLIQLITEWEAGSTADRSWAHVHMQLPLTIIGLMGCCRYRHELNLLCLGEEDALCLGVDVAKVRWRLFICVALLSGGALASLGIIAFFGLMLPHIVRKLVGTDHNELIPACLIGGAAALVYLDQTIRFFNIRSLSLGSVSAMIGGIFFLTLLFRAKQTAG